MMKENCENRRGSEKLARFDLHPKFEATKGYLSIKVGKDLMKFCQECGHMIRGYKYDLDKHNKRNHDGQEFDFLWYGVLP